MNKIILLTIDVEDWFQVENFKSSIAYNSWSDCELRVEENTHRLLNFFDSVSLDNDNRPKATFFVLGWIAKRYPLLIKEIAGRGHEVASHGFDHHLCSTLATEILKNDLIRSKKYLEDLTGEVVSGYRAPSFDINADILKIIEDCGYCYDSSYNSFSSHGRYGIVDLSSFSKKGIAVNLSQSFYELPVSNLSLKGKVIPWGGGGYFRLTPSLIFHKGVKSILKKEGAYLFYSHPWEFDPDQPRVEDVSAMFKFRHYINIKKTYPKMNRFIETFKDCLFLSCREYLAMTNQ